MELGKKIINVQNVTYIDYEFKNGEGYSRKPFIRLYIHFIHDFIMFDFDDEKPLKQYGMN